MKKVVKAEDVSKEQITEALGEYLKARNVSQRVFAVQVGTSDATINKMLNRKHQDISEAMWKKVWNAISSGNQISLVGTKDHNSITKVCDTARNKCLMIGLVGDTGMGKTTSLRIISRQRNTYYVSYDKTMKAKQFFATILKEMGIAFEGSIYDMVNLLAEVEKSLKVIHSFRCKLTQGFRSKLTHLFRSKLTHP